MFIDTSLGLRSANALSWLDALGQTHLALKAMKRPVSIQYNVKQAMTAAFHRENQLVLIFK